MREACFKVTHHDSEAVLGPLERTLWQLSPYLALLLTGGISLGLDALRSRWDAGPWIPYIALAGFAVQMIIRSVFS